MYRGERQEQQARPPQSRAQVFVSRALPDQQRNDRHDQKRFGPKLNGVGARDRRTGKRDGASQPHETRRREERAHAGQRRGRLGRGGGRPDELLRRQRQKKRGENRRDTIREQDRDDEIREPSRESHRNGVDDERSRLTGAEKPVDQTQQMGIGVRLLVVLAARTLQAAVLQRAVVAHLRASAGGEVLSDAL